MSSSTHSITVRKKLLHVLYSGQGGLGSYFMGFVRDDVNKRFEHHAIFYGVDPLFPEYKTFCEEHSIPFVYLHRDHKLDSSNYKKIAAYVDANDVAAVLIHTASMTPSAVFLRRTNARILFIDHTNPDFKNTLEKLYTVIGYLFSHRFYYFISFQLAALKKFLPWIGTTSTKFRKLVKSADPKRFFPRPTGPERRGTLTLGMAARMVPGKLQDLLIRSIRILRDDGIEVKLVLVGDGPGKESCVRLTEELAVSEQVIFAGTLRSGEMLEFYHTLDAYVHATIGETICLSILEAQACGLPILASDVPGVNDVLSQDTSALLFKNTLMDLTDKLRCMISDNQLRARLATASLNFTERNKPLKDIETVFSSLADADR
jgi:glycosyltransferase involved in cell wall biosynthesis